METQLLARITPEDRAALKRVAQLLKDAREAWNLIDSGKQCELNATHHEESSLAYCLRWGEQAASDLVELTQDAPNS